MQQAFNIAEIHNIDEIGIAQWQQCFSDDNPFTRFEFLQGLERTGCVGGASGWKVSHLVIKDEITHKKLMFDFISSRSEADAVYFANVMTDLARFHDNRIWLTEFKINPDNVTLAGMAENASVLPHWLDNLKQSDFFSGQSFSVMEFEQKNNTVMFTLAGLEKEAQP